MLLAVLMLSQVDLSFREHTTVLHTTSMTVCYRSCQDKREKFLCETFWGPKPSPSSPSAIERSVVAWINVLTDLGLEETTVSLALCDRTRDEFHFPHHSGWWNSTHG